MSLMKEVTIVVILKKINEIKVIFPFIFPYSDLRINAGLDDAHHHSNLFQI